MSKSVLLIEDFDPALDLSGKTLVSLTPRTSYELTKRGVPYRVLTDLYDEKELRRDEAAYFERQLEWISKFDDFFKAEIPFCRENGIELARIVYNRLKYFVDSLVIQSRISRAVVEYADGGPLFYAKERSAPWRNIGDFLYGEKGAFFSQLIPLMLPQGESARFKIMDVDPPQAGKKYVSLTTRLKGTLPPGLKRTLKGGYRYLKYGILRNVNAATSVRVFFVHSGSDHLNPVMDEFQRRGATVYCRSEAGFFRLGETGIDRVLFRDWEGSSVGDAGLKTDCERAAVALSTRGRDLFEWISRECGANVEAVAKPLLEGSIAQTCFRVLNRSRYYEAVFRANPLDYLVTHNSADLESKAALIAARKLGVKTLCVQHGCDVYRDLVWVMTDLDPFDLYLAMDTVSKEKFQEELKESWVRPCEVLESSHYLNAVKKNTRGPARSSIRTLLYIPTKLLVHQRHFNCMIYPIGWYFEYQKKLMDHFGHLAGYRILYKHAESRVSYASQSILPYLHDRGYKNITVKTGPVAAHLAKADAIIMDRPTTAFFEAMASERPVLALYPDFVQNIMDPDALKAFAPSLQSFASAENALAKIDAFLKDPQAYRPVLPLNDEGAVPYLMSRAVSMRQKSAEAVLS